MENTGLWAVSNAIIQWILFLKIPPQKTLLGKRGGNLGRAGYRLLSPPGLWNRENNELLILWLLIALAQNSTSTEEGDEPNSDEAVISLPDTGIRNREGRTIHLKTNKGNKRVFIPRGWMFCTIQPPKCFSKKKSKKLRVVLNVFYPVPLVRISNLSILMVSSLSWMAFFYHNFRFYFFSKAKPLKIQFPLELQTDTIITKSSHVRLFSDRWGRLLTLSSFLTEYSSCQVTSALGLIAARSSYLF